MDTLSLANDVILVKDQTTSKDNGLYLAASGAWTRIPQMNVSAEVPSAFTFVLNGSINAGRGYVVTGFSLSAVLGTDPITWIQFSQAGSYTAGMVST